MEPPSLSVHFLEKNMSEKKRLAEAAQNEELENYPKRLKHEEENNQLLNEESSSGSNGATIDTSLLQLDQQQEEDAVEGKNDIESDDEQEEEHEVYHFSPEELEIMMDDARCEGFWTWMARYSRFGLGSLLNAFGVPESIWRLDLEAGARMDEQLRILKSVFVERVQRRSRLEEYHSFEHAVELIHRAKKIIVLTGAGVSVSCGIPDFRSKNGIYSRLSEFQLSDPQEMFDLEYFKFKPETFYSFAKEIYRTSYYLDEYVTSCSNHLYHPACS